ncbi:hypothetical protein M408DRAFT_325571 [Serendipita vermifera MAFF 305830]|uniref:Zn(2)-C6 fungal-type domain-containing protein n=1 Tax=Serendipita vermifera MAFF 305830 TaxID=933852 RepID=A0A0C3BB47_SERVB|nr:hypothetical protein M408DRAFT_325571 [Serendipita vermifera MAFF 305830]
MQTTQTSRENKICQECKRLKIKCSRTIPCDQCIRRGVEEICPDGKLRSGRQGRYLLASSETLHEENKALKLRIRTLEQALGSSSPGEASTHPLLQPHLLSIARPYLADVSAPVQSQTVSEEDTLVNRFGTMQIDKWLGPTALSEVHLDFHDKEDDFIPEIDDHAKFAAPFSMLFPPMILNSMAIKNLPSKVEAWSLLETCYENATYAYNIIPREDFIQRIFSPAYNDNGATLSLYQTSTLYSVLALGALHDLSRPIYSPITREWMEIAQSLLMSSFGAWQTTLESIEASILLCYLLLARPELELSKVYFESSFVLKMAQTIGLHRNPEELGLDKQTSQRRRFLFTEICLFDASESLLYGRPFTMSSRFISEGAKGYIEPFDQSSHFRLGLAKIMEEVADHFMDVSSSSSYSNVLQLDRKLRSSQPPPPVSADAELQIGRYLRDVMHYVWYNSTLLTLHKPYFALAATKRTAGDSSGDKLSPSVFASYEASTNLLQMAITLMGIRPGLLARLSLIWPHLSTCMVVLYGFGIHLPLWFNTMHALSTADTGMSLVYLPSIECVRAKEILPYLSSLQQKAHASFLSKTLRPATSLQPPDEIAGLPAGISIQASQPKIKEPHQYDLLDRRGARSLALRHVNAYFSDVGEYFGHASNFMVNGLEGVSNAELGSLYSPPVTNPLPDTTFLNWAPDSDEGSSTGSEQISQLQLQQSWSDFLSHL